MNIKHLAILSIAASGSLIGLAFASPITLGPAFLVLTDTASNDIRFRVGESIFVGDNQVVPNGQGGTTGVAQTTNLATGATFTVKPVPFTGSTAIPNQFASSIPYDVNLIGPWTLNFINGANTASAITPSLVGVSPPPFAQNVTVSGSSANPTFAWTYSSPVDAIAIDIWDKSRTSASGGVDLVYTAGFPGSTTSFTVPSALAGGLSLQLNQNYAIGIIGTTLRDPTKPVSDANAAAFSEAIFDFTPVATGTPINLPIILPSGAYQYSMTVVAGQTYFVDPTVAVGYSFAIGAGDPNFASVLLPAVQADPFDLSFVYGGMSFSDMVSPDTVFDFPAGGVGAFTVTGIDPSDGIDPGDTTAFITGLTFESDGTFTGTQTPITADVAAAPEPGSLALLATGLLGWRLLRRRQGACQPCAI